MRNGEMTFTFPVHFRTGPHGRKRLTRGRRAEPAAVPKGRIPRISRLMALAIHFDQLLRSGAVVDYADLARLGGVTRARITQIMDLLTLAPDVQEDILHLPRVRGGRDAITERKLRALVAERDWAKQRRLWAGMQEQTKGM